MQTSEADQSQRVTVKSDSFVYGGLGLTRANLSWYDGVCAL
ncbi:hypothetical protein [Tengunoibacter tsumagoiensis]|uniref:Uncharacterized protein n=1 Tax=Tengunoibacter tsumagoiensis TaxID=2014871 RepID=A0A402A2K0_9CHLR|nr:hypothetical protein [Tengunoibacter tsumagoiensis]GCE13354.1 hypothetical protein KTT_32130 [Tengunoibacter tsumagoiensis]